MSPSPRPATTSAATIELAFLQRRAPCRRNSRRWRECCCSSAVRITGNYRWLVCTPPEWFQSRIRIGGELSESVGVLVVAKVRGRTAPADDYDGDSIITEFLSATELDDITLPRVRTRCSEWQRRERSACNGSDRSESVSTAQKAFSGPSATSLKLVDHSPRRIFSRRREAKCDCLDSGRETEGNCDLAVGHAY